MVGTFLPCLDRVKGRTQPYSNAGHQDVPAFAQMVDGLFVRRCKQGALQFVLVMPILGILSTVLYATGFYHPGNWNADSSCVSFLVATHADHCAD